MSDERKQKAGQTLAAAAGSAFSCPFCGRITGAAEVIVSVWSKEWSMLNAWLAKTHPELCGDPARTPWGVLSEQLRSLPNDQALPRLPDNGATTEQKGTKP